MYTCSADRHAEKNLVCIGQIHKGCVQMAGIDGKIIRRKGLIAKKMNDVEMLPQLYEVLIILKISGSAAVDSSMHIRCS